MVYLWSGVGTFAEFLKKNAKAFHTLSDYIP